MKRYTVGYAGRWVGPRNVQTLRKFETSVRPVLHWVDEFGRHRQRMTGPRFVYPAFTDAEHDAAKALCLAWIAQQTEVKP